MSSSQHPYKQVLEARTSLTREQARELMQTILAGELPELQLAALLGALAARGETPAELAGFVDALRHAATPIPLEDAERILLVDTCGTGADLSGTFNISTASALVAAAATPHPSAASRVIVAKHGNRAVTSSSGSADVLEALGVPVALPPEEAAAALREHGFAFLHAPFLHPALKVAMPVRRALGVRTTFNLLGPLSNPAGARAQVMGVYSARLVPLVAEAMVLLGVRHAFVVHGETTARGDKASAGAGLDEISISGPTHLAEVRNAEVTLHRLTPEELGLKTAPIQELRGGDAQTNAAILRAIFYGEVGPRRDIVVLNAGAALVAAGAVQMTHGGLIAALRDGMALAAHAIDSGAVTALLDRLVRK